MVIDTSGSMSAKEIGMALGSIASYAVAKEVPFAESFSVMPLPMMQDILHRRILPDGWRSKEEEVLFYSPELICWNMHPIFQRMDRF